MAAFEVIIRGGFSVIPESPREPQPRSQANTDRLDVQNQSRSVHICHGSGIINGGAL
jgi:hypothetical protein